MTWPTIYQAQPERIRWNSAIVTQVLLCRIIGGKDGSSALIMSANKRKSAAEDDASDSSLSSLEVKSETSKKLPDVRRETSASGDKLIDLTGKKYVTVRNFKGRIFVDIREYYEDKSDGGLKPGKKGISLNVEQWDKLREVMDVLNADIKKM
ncbi:Transcriptional coactivator [Sparganum proliferum]